MPAPFALCLVPTPIGNLEDITLRAIRILREVDTILAEDTRTSGQLLKHLEIKKPLQSYHTFNEHGTVDKLIKRLLGGERMALVSDAGTPGISDPGFLLVRACLAAGVVVECLPGPTALVPALIKSGLPADRFVFEGFLPPKGSERRDRLEALQTESRTIVLYEAPHRLRQTLADLTTALGDDRPLVLARELTKRFEEFWRGTLAEAIAVYRDREPVGEFTVLIAGASATAPLLSESALKSELQHLLQQGLSRSQASRQLAQQTALPRRQVYQLALAIPDPTLDP